MLDKNPREGLLSAVQKEAILLTPNCHASFVSKLILTQMIKRALASQVENKKVLKFLCN